MCLPYSVHAHVSFRRSFGCWFHVLMPRRQLPVCQWKMTILIRRLTRRCHYIPYSIRPCPCSAGVTGSKFLTVIVTLFLPKTDAVSDAFDVEYFHRIWIFYTLTAWTDRLEQNGWMGMTHSTGLYKNNSCDSLSNCKLSLAR